MTRPGKRLHDSVRSCKKQWVIENVHRVAFTPLARRAMAYNHCPDTVCRRILTMWLPQQVQLTPLPPLPRVRANVLVQFLNGGSHRLLWLLRQRSDSCANDPAMVNGHAVNKARPRFLQQAQDTHGNGQGTAQEFRLDALVGASTLAIRN